MRELSSEELALVAGGTNGASEERHWWQDAFDWLSDGLSALGDLFPGWMGDYLSGWSTVVDHMDETGNTIDQYTQGYYDYCVDAQSEGNACLPFDEWVGENGGGG